MTQPALAFSIRGQGRHYPWPPRDISDLPTNRWGSVDPDNIPDTITALPSVTNILGVLDKPALLGWSAEQALRELYESGDIPTDVEAAIERHKYACNRARNRRADAGTRAHTLAEKLATDQPLPASISEEDEAFADAFMSFVVDHDPDWTHVEVTLANPQHGYAGTADWIATLGRLCGDDCGVYPGATVLGDYKTRGEPADPKKIAKHGLLYDENRAQLAALAAATHRYEPLGRIWQTPRAPYVDYAMGVVLYPDGTYRHEVLDLAALAVCFDGFLGALQTWRWLKGRKGVAA